ncbi:CLUMA_CG003871, isoform A [Clunio marinus]|uniref:CLUMA_CG003871, isoform A n=1 Tax=Clunio marinus TaxID=568069 RepID=A0A1J1HQ99_9DIPT|nr:CLUMA_CG003871, isoform A [Clunio marinus]
MLEFPKNGQGLSRKQLNRMRNIEIHTLKFSVDRANKSELARVMIDVTDFITKLMESGACDVAIASSFLRPTDPL